MTITDQDIEDLKEKIDGEGSSWWYEERIDEWVENLKKLDRHMTSKNFLKHKGITDRQIPIWSEKKYILLSELLEEFANIKAADQVQDVYENPPHIEKDYGEVIYSDPSTVKYPWVSSSSSQTQNQEDADFLQWIHDRLINVYLENENYDYMHRLKGIIDKHRTLNTEPKYKSFGDWIIKCDDVKVVDRVFYQYKGNLVTGAQLKEKYNQLKELNKL